MIFAVYFLLGKFIQMDYLHIKMGLAPLLVTLHQSPFLNHQIIFRLLATVASWVVHSPSCLGTQRMWVHTQVQADTKWLISTLKMCLSVRGMPVALGLGLYLWNSDLSNSTSGPLKVKGPIQQPVHVL